MENPPPKKYAHLLIVAWTLNATTQMATAGMSIIEKKGTWVINQVVVGITSNQTAGRTGPAGTANLADGTANLVDGVSPVDGASPVVVGTVGQSQLKSRLGLLTVTIRLSCGQSLLHVILPAIRRQIQQIRQQILQLQCRQIRRLQFRQILRLQSRHQSRRQCLHHILRLIRLKSHPNTPQKSQRGCPVKSLCGVLLCGRHLHQLGTDGANRRNVQ
mmetsp:Transcript_2516/g.3750  ORF Transcript_2516/g.3750 Transcript_2516/m.3750 type:complete len:216 (-) Transcript_2516:568-1215(-)